jgi:actin-like ATPase involved in cell morphogenesis
LTYSLGVDLGTTYTAAAIARHDRVEVVTLGANAATVPSVIFVRDDDTIVVGEAAARRALTDPTRVVREFKRRFGDPTSIIVAGSPYAPDALMAKLLAWVVDAVAEREGGRPDRIALTYPANWGPYKQDLLAQALRLADVGDVSTITEPEAAAISYAATERVQPGAVIAVYDLGGGTFDAAVLRKTDDGFTLLGRPEGIEHLGGVDFDEAVFAHVRNACTEAFVDLDTSDPGVRAAVAHVRQECTTAKEALSDDTEAAIPVLLTVHTQVRLTRAEFEEMIRPTLAPTVAALSRAVASAGLATSDVDTILLAGGSSRIPLVGQLIAAELARPVAVDVHPKHAVAMGAARWAAQGRGVIAPAIPTASVVDVFPDPAPAPSEPKPITTAYEDTGTDVPRPSRRGALIALGVVLALALGAVALAGGGGSAGGPDTSTAARATTVAPEAPSTSIDASSLLAAQATSERDVTKRLGAVMNHALTYRSEHRGHWPTTDSEIAELSERVTQGFRENPPGYYEPVSAVQSSEVPVLPSTAVAARVAGSVFHAAGVAEGGACFYIRHTPGTGGAGNEYAVFRPAERASRGSPRGQVAPAGGCPPLVDALYTRDYESVWGDY